MNNPYKNRPYGFIPDEIKSDHYLAGVLPYDVLQEDGNWEKFLPPIEYQRKNGVETMACATFAILNCYEALLKRVYGIDVNFSERFTAILGGTTENGARPHDVCEAVRKYKVLPEVELPFETSITTQKDFLSPNPMEQKYIDIAKKCGFDFKHEWVGTKGNVARETLKYYLKASPLGVSVDAWNMSTDDVKGKNYGMYVKEKGVIDNHFCMLYGYEDGEHWKVYDTYDNTHKMLAWDYDFTYVKRFYVQKITLEEKPTLSDDIRSLIAVIVAVFGTEKAVQFIRYVMRDRLGGSFFPMAPWVRQFLSFFSHQKQMHIYAQVCKGISFAKQAPPELACAESVSTIQNMLFGDPIITGTWTLTKWYEKSVYWKEIYKPENGCVVMATTGTGITGTNGHVGIYDNGKIWSNDSATGTWKDAFTMASFEKRYKEGFIMPIRFFVRL